MRNFFILIPFILIQAGSALAVTEQSIAPDLKVREIEPGLYVIKDNYPIPANSVIVEMKDSNLFWIDTTWSPQAAEDIIAWIKKKFGKRKIIAINTHYHLDRTGGNAALIKHGIPVYGSEEIAGLLKEHTPGIRKFMLKETKGNPELQKYYKTAVFTPPDHPFPLSIGLMLTSGNENIRVMFKGEAHSKDNVVVYFQDRMLLVGGCMILAGKTLGNTADANLNEWANTIKAIRDYGYKFKYVIPGHGDSTSPDLIQNTLDVLAKKTKKKKEEPSDD